MIRTVRDVDVLVIGLEEEDKNKLVLTHEIVRETCQSWCVRFLIVPRRFISTLDDKVREYRNLEIVHVMNESNLTLKQLVTVQRQLAKALPEHERKPVVNVEVNFIYDLLKARLTNARVGMMSESLGTAIQMRYKELRPVARLHLVDTAA